MRLDEICVRLPQYDFHPKQAQLIDCEAKRIVVRAGRRSGKTTGVAIRAVKRFLAGRRVLYAAPTYDQTERCWSIITHALREPIQAGILRKNETMRLIELPGTEQRIRAKTAWNADSMRGDYADDVILDEFQLMAEDTWELVIAPMLLDNNGDALFVYTPLSLHNRAISKAKDPQYVAKFFKKAQQSNGGRWATFHFTSRDNPTLDPEALAEIAQDMSALAYRMEIDAEDVDEAPGALWKRENIDKYRVSRNAEYDLDRIVVGIDPTGTAGGDEAGIVADGRIGNELYVLEDRSMHGRPEQWATAAVNLFHDLEADRIVAEKNYGGEMVEHTIRTIDPDVPLKLVDATRGKAVRAEPISAIYEQGRAHHIGDFPRLEDEMCLWTPGDRKSPNRMDAHVFAATELMLGFQRKPGDFGVS